MNCAILAGELFDGVHPEVKRDQVILTEGERIRAVGPRTELRIPPGYRTLDYGNAFVSPGLVDTHLHLSIGGLPEDDEIRREDNHLTILRCANNARRELWGGVTTVREAGAKGILGITIRRAIREKIVPGPRILICGQPIIITGGHTHYMGVEADGPEAVRHAVRQQVKTGVDWVKIMATGGIMTPGMSFGAPQMTRGEIAAAVEEAHRAGRKISAHANGEEGIRDCVEAGIDSIEHGIGVTEELAREMEQRGTWYIPTLGAIHLIAVDGEKDGQSAQAVSKAKEAVPVHRRSFEAALGARVRMAAGTDYKHPGLWLELRLMAEYGLAPAQALLLATGAAAEFLGMRPRVGTLEPGAFADVAAFGGNPLEDFTRLQDVRLVMQGGELIIPCSGDSSVP